MTKSLYNTLYLPILLVGLLACAKKDDIVDPVAGGGNTTTLTGNTEATDAQSNQYTVGFDQASSNNQNPYVIKKDGQGNQLWKVTYENTGVDGRAVLVTVDANNVPWVVFTVDGGSNDAGYITKKQINADAFSGVYMNSYGSGGGPKASVIAQLDPATGNIVKGSFMTARLTSGKTNTLNITKIGFNNGNFAFEISSAAWPPGKGSSYVRFPDITDDNRIDGAFKIYYEIKTDLSEIVVATLLTQ
ncbi:hypothetical protein [Microscilla marina]|uniref:Lipoprotein, putative n=1 Tax=Microscilla marina ATCC 23134 TaxID=313606 RepID=A1ZC52_MICM2|nr:hypothetical protein [Microscilla marina]EAY31854.1 lipoprotein, putative [Microscilla marina ATCC 23134]